MIQSLLSDVVVGGDDNRLSNEQKTNVYNSVGNLTDNTATIITGNEPVNILRKFALQGNKRWECTDQILDQAKDFTLKIKNYVDECSVTLNEEQLARIQFIYSCHKKLHSLRTSIRLPGINHNYEAFKVAYQSLLVESLGGVVSSNCKSGKDRTGLMELYRDSLLTYYKKNKKFPSSEKTDDQDEFILIFRILFDSMKTQESAANNTPGSFGLKDSAKMLCPTIANAMKLSYEASNDRSGMNKPPLFLEDETKQKNEDKSMNTINEDWERTVIIIKNHARNTYNHIDEITEKNMAENPKTDDMFSNDLKRKIESEIKSLCNQRQDLNMAANIIDLLYHIDKVKVDDLKLDSKLINNMIVMGFNKIKQTMNEPVKDTPLTLSAPNTDKSKRVKGLSLLYNRLLYNRSLFKPKPNEKLNKSEDSKNSVKKKITALLELPWKLT